MRPESLFPLFADVTGLKGVGPRIAPLVQKVAGSLVRDVVFLSPVGLITRRRMTAVDAVEGEVGIFEVVIDRMFVPGKPGVPLKVRASDDTGFVHLVWFGARRSTSTGSSPGASAGWSQARSSGSTTRSRSPIRTSFPWIRPIASRRRSPSIRRHRG